MYDAILAPVQQALDQTQEVSASPADNEFILTLSCPDRRGIVSAVASSLTRKSCNILDSAQFGDRQTGQFFMRVHFVAPAYETSTRLNTDFAALAQQFDMEWQIVDHCARPKLMIMVSKLGHCLNDLLYRYRSGNLAADICAVVSNHRDFEALVKAHGIPFYHLPITPESKLQQEQKLLDLVREHQIELVVLARYMQVLSPALSRLLRGKVINIHHSFLPSFKGARPYAQAHDRGVKLIGATAHFVTDDLDEGPIIEQDVVRVSHALNADALTAIGRDVESIVLARAVNWYLQRRILLNGNRTVVFGN